MSRCFDGLLCVAHARSGAGRHDVTRSRIDALQQRTIARVNQFSPDEHLEMLHGVSLHEP
jgi:hypothetical protein